MGQNCCSSSSEDGLPVDKTETLKIDQGPVRKLLMLGTGSSGKSTFLKTAKLNDGADIIDKVGTNDQVLVAALRSSIMFLMAKMVLAALKCGEQGGDDDDGKFAHCVPDTQLEAVEELKKLYTEMTSPPKVMAEPLTEVEVSEMVAAEFGKRLGQCVETLWAQQWLQNTYQSRFELKLAIPDNMFEFFPRASEILNHEQYMFTEMDARLMSVRTTGIVEYKYTYGDTIFNLIDTGGQRSERIKWRNFFDNVSALLWFVALNHYCEALFEDSSVNAMHESINTFAEYVNEEYFKEMRMVIFTKKDLFATALERVPLGQCFGRDVAGWEGPQYWEGPDMPGYADAEDDEKEVRAAKREECVNEAAAFIEQVFRSKSKSDKSFHVLTVNATDAENVKDLLWNVNTMVIRNNLQKSSLMVE